MTKEFNHPNRGVGLGDEVEDEASLEIGARPGLGAEASLEIEDEPRIEAKASLELGTPLVIGGVGPRAKAEAEASLEIGPRVAPELDINSTIERLGLMR